MAKGSRKDSSNTLSVEQMFILDQCALIEKKCGDLYRLFARKCSGHPELEKLWKKTALEEDHHALQFEMLSRLKGEGLSKVKADPSRIRTVLQELEALMDRVEHSKISPIDTLKVGIRLETSLARYHSDEVAICSDPETAHLLQAMMNNDVDHVAALEKALGKLVAEKE